MRVNKIQGMPLPGGMFGFHIETADRKAAETAINSLKPDKDYDFNISEHKEKRSLDANGYCWVLCRKIAEAIDSVDEEVYRHSIIDYGVCEIVPIKTDEVEERNRMWCSQGKGYQAVILGEAKTDGYTNVKRYYGSSVYHTRQMSRLIDGIVYDAQELGVDTKTPGEIERIKQLWGADT